MKWVVIIFWSGLLSGCGFFKPVPEYPELNGSWNFDHAANLLIVKSDVQQNLVELRAGEHGEVECTGALTLTGAYSGTMDKMIARGPSFFYEKNLLFHSGNGQTDPYDLGENRLYIYPGDETWLAKYWHHQNAARTSFTANDFHITIDYNQGTLSIPQTTFYSDSTDTVLQIAGQFQFPIVTVLQPGQEYIFKTERRTQQANDVAAVIEFSYPGKVCVVYNGDNYCGEWDVYKGELRYDCTASGGPVKWYQYSTSQDSLRFVRYRSENGKSNIAYFLEAVQWFAEEPTHISVFDERYLLYLKQH